MWVGWRAGSAFLILTGGSLHETLPSLLFLGDDGLFLLGFDGLMG